MSISIVHTGSDGEDAEWTLVQRKRPRKKREDYVVTTVEPKLLKQALEAQRKYKWNHSQTASFIRFGDPFYSTPYPDYQDSFSGPAPELLFPAGAAPQDVPAPQVIQDQPAPPVGAPVEPDPPVGPEPDLGAVAAAPPVLLPPPPRGLPPIPEGQPITPEGSGSSSGSYGTAANTPVVVNPYCRIPSNRSTPTGSPLDQTLIPDPFQRVSPHSPQDWPAFVPPTPDQVRDRFIQKQAVSPPAQNTRSRTAAQPAKTSPAAPAEWLKKKFSRK